MLFVTRSSFFFDLAVCRIRTFNVGTRSTYLKMSSVRGPSMSGNGDTKVSRHSKNHVADIGPFGENLATFRDVADMSPTFPAKGLPIASVNSAVVCFNLLLAIDPPRPHGIFVVFVLTPPRSPTPPSPRWPH